MVLRGGGGDLSPSPALDKDRLEEKASISLFTPVIHICSVTRSAIVTTLHRAAVLQGHALPFDSPLGAYLCIFDEGGWPQMPGPRDALLSSAEGTSV